MITRVDGIRVGHHTDRTGITGSTVVLCPPGTSGSCDVKGGAPGTRETDAIRPGTITPEVHAVVLSGGSAFGLAAADGVMRWLEEHGVGFDTGLARVPIVPAAILFDLAVGDPTARPDSASGYAACGAATGGDVEEGSVGAGTGATVAKHPDPSAGWKGGVGTAAVEDGEVIVAALAVVNGLGDITEDDGTPIAANRNPEAEPAEWPGRNTTLAVVATNATCSKERAQLLAQAGSEGISLAVRPSHTMYDGDVVFALATGATEAPQPTLERLAVQAVAESIRRAVRMAEPLGGFPAVGTLD
ncbi:MAG TPA: P1 family peptidase [Actinomycetota bacterium]|jgi:L-aminopeptidase/D-esterase-like protein|nr:P1 family peptidase [Actinomycetota bacterium]